jgi:hypothetical protein
LEKCVGSRVHLVGVSISFEKNFYQLPFTPPLSGSPYRSFSWEGRWGKRWRRERGDATACLMGGCCSVLSGRRKRIQEEKSQRNKSLEVCVEIESGEKKGGLLLCSAALAV